MSSAGTTTSPRVIVALDYPDAASAQAFVSQVTPPQCRLKVGSELFTSAGPALVENLAGRGFDVFLDLKFHDIPSTVAAACTAAANLGVWMLNVHALGGRQMLLAAREAVGKSSHRPLLVAVTVLTSHSAEDLGVIGLPKDPEGQVMRLAQLVKGAGLDGVVCSAREAPRLRTEFGPGFCLVTPGIRPAGTASDDQKRIVTPLEAVRLGAHYLVIGRPVTRATDPQAVLADIQREIAAA